MKLKQSLKPQQLMIMHESNMKNSCNRKEDIPNCSQIPASLCSMARDNITLHIESAFLSEPRQIPASLMVLIQHSRSRRFIVFDLRLFVEEVEFVSRVIHSSNSDEEVLNTVE